MPDDERERELMPWRSRLSELDAKLSDLRKALVSAKKGEVPPADGGAAAKKVRVEAVERDVREAQRVRDTWAAKKPRFPTAYAVAEATPQDVSVQIAGNPSSTGVMSFGVAFQAVSIT